MSIHPHNRKRAARRWVWIGAIVLLLFHHDFWYWDSSALALGFLPMGLAYQAGFSIAAALLWVAAMRWAWPADLEAWADTTDSHDPRDLTEAQQR
jgi:hypothetical protein